MVSTQRVGNREGPMLARIDNLAPFSFWKDVQLLPLAQMGVQVRVIGEACVLRGQLQHLVAHPIVLCAGRQREMASHRSNPSAVGNRLY